ncbi:MAG: amidohydrolase, partial [Thermoproteota archaeon]
MNNQNTYRSIGHVINEVKIIDTHEHLIPETERVTKHVDIFETFLSHYASSDLIPAGMSPEELEKIRDA